MIIDIITIFPEFYGNIFEYGVIKEAFNKDLCKINIYNLRDFSKDKHRKVDDRPYGGGPGMVFMPEPLGEAISFIKKKNRIGKDKQLTVLLTPKGVKLEQPMLKNFLGFENLILVCGRYEGIDQRAIDLYIDLELSIGDYILTGGEIPSLVVIDGLVRLMPGVVGKEESLLFESFENNLLDYPLYTRPVEYRGLKVPKVLLSGDHKKIQEWRKGEAEELTKRRRPDLFDKKR